MLKRLLVLTFAAIALVASPASAGEYPPEDDSITTSDPTVDKGQTVTVTAECFEPGSTVQFSVAGTSIGSGVANASGVASVQYTVPDGSGDIVVTATGTGCDGEPLVLTVTLTRNAATPVAAPGGSALPETGSSSSVPLARIAVSLLGVGALAVFAARYRQRRTATLGA